MADAGKIVEVGSLILGAAFKLFPEIADLVTGAYREGKLSGSVAAAVEAAMPLPSPTELAL
jgi:hypothetical protein